MAKDFVGQDLRIHDFVALPAAHGRGLRLGIIYFCDLEEDRVSVFTDDLRVVHGESTDVLRLADRKVPGATRKDLVDGIVGLFHPRGA